jgi:hypothetical protein
MVAEILAGIALAKTAVSGIKSAINTAKDVNDIAHFVDDLFKGYDQSRHAAKKATEKAKKGDKKWRNFLRAKFKDEDDEVSMSDTIAEVIEQKQIEEQMEATKRMLNRRFGGNTWDDIVELRNKKIEALKKKRAKEKEQREIAAEQKRLGQEDIYDKILKFMWQIPLMIGFILGMWWFISYNSKGNLPFLW